MTVTILIAATATWLTGIGVPVTGPSVHVTNDPAGVCRIANAAACFDGGGNRIVIKPKLSSSVIHELSHAAHFQARGPLLSREAIAWDEAAAASLETDILRAWTRQVAPRGVYLDSKAYPRQAAWLRGVSSAACWCAPDSRGARLWRRAWVTGDRPAMLAAAMQVPMKGLNP